MFLATGVSTKNFVHQVNPQGVSCDDIGRLGPQFDELKKICNEWEPIEIVSWISAGLRECSPFRLFSFSMALKCGPPQSVFLYSVTLLIISIMRGYGGKSMWGTSVKNSEI